MDATHVIQDGFDRVRQVVSSLLDDIDAATLSFRPDDGSNHIGWLVWHLARVQDDHVAGVSGRAQVWHSDGWRERFALPLDDPDGIGYGHSAEQVAAVQVPDPSLLAGYLDAVHRQTSAYLGSIDDGALDRVVDDTYDPPVTVGARLVSVLSDDLQHAGQAAYLRGLAERSG